MSTDAKERVLSTEIKDPYRSVWARSMKASSNCNEVKRKTCENYYHVMSYSMLFLQIVELELVLLLWFYNRKVFFQYFFL